MAHLSVLDLFNYMFFFKITLIELNLILIVMTNVQLVGLSLLAIKIDVLVKILCFLRGKLWCFYVILSTIILCIGTTINIFNLLKLWVLNNLINDFLLVVITIMVRLLIVEDLLVSGIFVILVLTIIVLGKLLAILRILSFKLSFEPSLLVVVLITQIAWFDR